MQMEPGSLLPAGDWPVYGHTWAVQLLVKTAVPEPHTGEHAAVRTGPSHAYLLLGAPQIGKTTLAKAYAKALLCTHPSQRPCHHCRACDLVARNVHPDVQLFQPRSKLASKDEQVVDRVDGKILADQADILVHEAALRPLEGRYRILLIQDAHRANDTFQNKVLKTLEEPPPNTILLLTALDRSSVLPTIASRCQVLNLRPLDGPTVEQALRVGWQAAPEQAALYARLSNGRLGWAVNQLRDPESSQQRAAQLQTLWHLLAADRVERLAFAETMASERSTGRDNRPLFGMLELWTGWWRDVLLVQAGCAEACSNVDQASELQRQAGLIEQEPVRKLMHTLQRIEQYLHHTVNTRLALDVLVLNLPYLQRESLRE
jgi:DNA polymerase III subunit delta'